MRTYPSIIIAAVMAACVPSSFAQGTVVFNNGTGLVLQETYSGFMPVPKGGGQGEGKMSMATKLNFDKKKNAVELENHSSEPVRLQQVKLEK